jgi:hypothetical protein
VKVSDGVESVQVFEANEPRMGLVYEINAHDKTAQTVTHLHYRRSVGALKERPHIFPRVQPIWRENFAAPKQGEESGASKFRVVCCPDRSTVSTVPRLTLLP